MEMRKGRGQALPFFIEEKHHLVYNRRIIGEFYPKVGKGAVYDDTSWDNCSDRIGDFAIFVWHGEVCRKTKGAYTRI